LFNSIGSDFFLFGVPNQSEYGIFFASHVQTKASKLEVVNAKLTALLM